MFCITLIYVYLSLTISSQKLVEKHVRNPYDSHQTTFSFFIRNPILKKTTPVTTKTSSAISAVTSQKTYPW
jgi:hypothetical protein